MALTALLDAAAARCVPPNDSRLAVAVGVTRSAVSVWRKGGRISTHHLARVIEIAGVDPAIAADVLAEQAEDKAEVRVWENVARRLAVSAAGVAALYYFGDHGGDMLATLTALPFMHYAKLWMDGHGALPTVR